MGVLGVHGVEERLGAGHGLVEAVGLPRGIDGFGPGEAVARGEALPFDGQHAMALQVPEGAVVGEDVEAVEAALEGPSRLVATVGPLAAVGPHDRQPLVGGHGSHPGLDLGLGPVGVGVEHARHHLHLGVRVEVDQGHVRSGPRPRPGSGRPWPRPRPWPSGSRPGSCSRPRPGRARRPGAGTTGSPSAARSASSPRTTGPPAAGGPACATGAARSPGRCRRCRRWTARPRAGSPAGRRTPWPGWTGGRRSRSRPGPWGCAPGRTRPGWGPARRRCRRGGPCRRRSGCRGRTAARRGRGSSGSGRRCGRRRRCTGWTARGRP